MSSLTFPFMLSFSLVVSPVVSMLFEYVGLLLFSMSLGWPTGKLSCSSPPFFAMKIMKARPPGDSSHVSRVIAVV